MVFLLKPIVLHDLKITFIEMKKIRQGQAQRLRNKQVKGIRLEKNVGRVYRHTEQTIKHEPEANQDFEGIIVPKK